MKFIMQLGIFIGFYGAITNFYAEQITYAVFFLGLSGLCAVVRLTLIVEEKN